MECTNIYIQRAVCGLRLRRRDVLRGVAAWSAERSAMEDPDVGSKKRKSPRTPKAGWTTVRVKGETPKKEKYRSIAVFEWIKMQVTLHYAASVSHCRRN